MCCYRSRPVHIPSPLTFHMQVCWSGSRTFFCGSSSWWRWYLSLRSWVRPSCASYSKGCSAISSLRVSPVSRIRYILEWTADLSRFSKGVCAMLYSHRGSGENGLHHQAAVQIQKRLKARKEGQEKEEIVRTYHRADSWWRGFTQVRTCEFASIEAWALMPQKNTDTENWNLITLSSPQRAATKGEPAVQHHPTCADRSRDWLVPPLQVSAYIERSELISKSWVRCFSNSTYSFYVAHWRERCQNHLTHIQTHKGEVILKVYT